MELNKFVQKTIAEIRTGILADGKKDHASTEIDFDLALVISNDNLEVFQLPTLSPKEASHPATSSIKFSVQVRMQEPVSLR